MAWRVALVVGLLVAGIALVSGRPSPLTPEAEADRLFHRVMSPYCPGRVLATCGSSAAEVLRKEIRQDLAAGRPADEVEDELYRRFGESIRGVPQTRGIGLLAWVVPAIAFVLTGGWLVRRMTRIAKFPEKEDESAVTASPEMLERLEDELASL